MLICEDKKTKKAMLSQPMGDKTDEEIKETRDKAIKVLEGNGYEVVNTLFTDEWHDNKEDKDIINRPLYFLAHSLIKMAQCDLVYFCKGWEEKRGCKVEHECAKAYGIEIIYEE